MRTFSPNTEGLLDDSITRPLVICEFGFATPLRLSSRETLTWNSNSYSAASIAYNNGKLRLFNSDSYSSTFISEGTAGISCKIYQLYGESPFVTADADLIFDGELGGAVIGEYIDIKLIDSPVLFAPRLYPAAPTFNHIPPDGTELTTRNGVFRIDRGQ